MQIRRNKTRPAASHRRRGAAPIELVFCLPFLVGCLGVIFTLASAGQTRSVAAVAARHNGWRERNNTWQDSETYQQHDSDVLGANAVGLMLALGDGYSVRAGLLEGLDERPVPVAHPGYVPKNLTTDANHFVLGGAWDHRRIPSKDRGRLVPSNLFTSLPFDGMPDMSGFTDLLKADEIADAGPLQDSNKIQEELEKGKQQAEAQIAELKAQIADLEKQIDELWDEDPPDLAKIQQLENQIDAIEHQIDEIEEGLEEMEKAGSQLPG